MGLVHFYLRLFTWFRVDNLHTITHFFFYGLPWMHGRTFSFSFSLLTSFLLLVGKIHIFLSLFGSHPGPQFTCSSRYYCNMLIRLLAAKSQKKNDERIRCSRPDMPVLLALWTLAGGFAASVYGLSTFSSICATWKAKLQSMLLRAPLIS